MNRADGGLDIVMKHADIRDGCRSWEWKMKDFELAVSELLDVYRNKIPLGQAVDAMRAQCKLLIEDQSWSVETPPPPEAPEPEGEPPAAA